MSWLSVGAARKEASTNPADKDKTKKVSNPSVVVESFKQMLVHVKRRLDTQSDEVRYLLLLSLFKSLCKTIIF